MKLVAVHPQAYIRSLIWLCIVHAPSNMKPHSAIEIANSLMHGDKLAMHSRGFTKKSTHYKSKISDARAISSATLPLEHRLFLTHNQCTLLQKQEEVSVSK